MLRLYATRAYCQNQQPVLGNFDRVVFSQLRPGWVPRDAQTGSRLQALNKNLNW